MDPDNVCPLFFVIPLIYLIGVTYHEICFTKDLSINRYKYGLPPLQQN